MAPARTCVGCRRVRPADELVRVTCDPSGALHLGRERPGRGAWLCRGSPTCVETAVRRRAFDRALRAPVDPASAEALVTELREAAERAEGSGEPSC